MKQRYISPFKYPKQQLAFFAMLLLVLCAIPNISNAQQLITLKQAINQGLSNKKNIVAAKLDNEVLHLQTQALYSKYWPQLAAEYNYQYNPILQTSILPIGIFNPSYPADATKNVQFGTKWSQSAGLSANQPLLDLSIPRQINESKLQEKITAFSQANSEYELAYTIAQAYLAVCLDESKVKTALSDTLRTSISLSAQQSKFDEKRLLKTDLNKSLINHNLTKQQLSDGITTLIEDKILLLYLMGETDMKKWDFAIDSTFAMNFPNEQIANRPSYDQLPAIEKLILQSQLNQLKAKSEKAKLIPTISLKGYIGANQFTNTFNPVAANSWFGQSYVGLNAKIPLLYGENLLKKLELLKTQTNQLELQKEDLTNQYVKDAYTAKIKIERIKSQLQTLQENLRLSLESVSIFQLRFTEGQESATTLNGEEANLQNLSSELESKRKELWVYWLDYLKSTGQLSKLWE